MSEPKYGLQLMRDDYIIEELIKELRETSDHHAYRQKVI